MPSVAPDFAAPTIRFNAKDPTSGTRNGARLSSGALTNQPFLDGMQPLAASARGITNTQGQAHMTLSLPALDSTIERLVSLGHHPTKARALALSAAGRALAASINARPSDVVQLADRVRAGEATIVQLAEAIAADRRILKDEAFGEAERMLRASR